MKHIKLLTLLLSGLLCLTCLLACTTKVIQADDDDDNDKDQSQVTQTTPSAEITTQSPVTTLPPVTDQPTPPVTDVPTPPVTDVPTPPATDVPTPPVTDVPTPPVTDVPTPPVTDEPTPPVTDVPTPPVTDGPVLNPTDYTNLLPSELYSALINAEGFTIVAQSGPASITYDKKGDLLYTFAWDDSEDTSEEFYIDFSTGYYFYEEDGIWIKINQEGLTWQSALDSIGLYRDLFFFNDSFYDLSNPTANMLKIQADALEGTGVTNAYLQRIGTTYILFMSEENGDDFKITLSFKIPEVTLPA